MTEKQSDSSYRQILKATSLIGGSSLINIMIRMVRTKFVAVLLGPSGIGLMGIYSAIVGTVRTISVMGIDNSGVRLIAEAIGDGNETRIARIVKTLRRTVWMTGILGMAAMILGCAQLSRYSFGNSGYALPIAFLSIIILLNNISTGQSCLLQGMRRIGDLAKVSIIGALNGTFISLPCFYFWGQRGIVPSLIITALAALVTSWWYARRISIQKVIMSIRDSLEDGSELLKFGLPLMLAGLMTTLTDYLIRVLLVRQVGLDGVGIWQAAFNLSGILVNFVLNAMGTDYYPRLTALVHDDKQVIRAVNEQTEIALLLAVPGLAATIIFAPLAISIFYTGKFDASVDILRWSVYGILGRVVSWPLGFILLAKGMGKTFFCTEAVSNLFYIVSVWYCTRFWGLPGTGIAFLFLYVFYTLMMYIIVYFINHTRWSRSNSYQIIFFCMLLAAIGFISKFVVNPWYQFPLNCLILIMICIYCSQCLLQRSGTSLRTLILRIKP